MGFGNWLQLTHRILHPVIFFCLIFSGSLSAQNQAALTTTTISEGVVKVAPPISFSIEHSSTVTLGQERVFKMTGPFGGDVEMLAVDPRDAHHILTGTNDGQLFRSTDDGITWKRLKPGLNAHGFSIKTILFDREKAGVIYVGCNQIKDAVDDATGGDLFVTSNNGESWREIMPLRGRSIRGMVQASIDPNVLLIASRDGIYRTKDRGQNWERITPDNDPELKAFHSVAVDPRDANIIYVGTSHLPWKTLDGGLTWKLAGNKETGLIDDSDIFSIRISEENPDTVLLSACSGIYRTLNAGEKWTKIQGMPFESRRTHTIYRHPSRPEVIFAGTTEGLWRTIDDGQNWAAVTSRRQVINAVSVNPAQPDRVYIGTQDGGIQISIDGGENFEPSNIGFVSRQVRVVKHDRTERGRVYAGILFDDTAGGFFVSNDGGLTWEQATRGMGKSDVFTIYQLQDRPETIYAGTNHGLYRSDDRGLSWAKVLKEKSSAPKPNELPQITSTKPASTVRNVVQKKPVQKRPATKSKVVVPKDDTVDLQKQIFSIAQLFPRSGEETSGLIVTTWDGLFINRDEKKGWKQIKFDNTSYPFFNTVVTNPAVPGLILVGTEVGLFVSRDNGDSFAPMPFAGEAKRVQNITFDPREASTIYVGTSSGFFITNDGGQTWDQRSNGLRTQVAASAVVLNPANPDELYVGDQWLGGLFHSKNKGKSWELINTGKLPSNRFWSLSADPFDASTFCAGSFSGGVMVISKQPIIRKRVVNGEN